MPGVGDELDAVQSAVQRASALQAELDAAGVGRVDWLDVAARMAFKVDECCRCRWATYLNEQEAAAVEAVLAEYNYTDWTHTKIHKGPDGDGDEPEVSRETAN